MAKMHLHYLKYNILLLNSIVFYYIFYRNVQMDLLTRIQTLIIRRAFRLSGHVDEGIDEGVFDLDDIEHCIMSATRIYKTERDERGTALDGNKYTIMGRNRAGLLFYTCGKLRQDHLGHYYFFITAHAAD